MKFLPDSLLFCIKIEQMYTSKAFSVDRMVNNFLEDLINPRSLLEKIVTRSHEGGGVNRTTPPPFYFRHNSSADLKFGTYSKLHLYFQLSETTWWLIGFHGNNCQINDVTGGRHLGFSNFQITFKFLLL